MLNVKDLKKPCKTRMLNLILNGWKDMKKEKLNEWGYPIHQEMNFQKPQGDFETRIALIIAFSLIIIGILYGKF